MHVSTVGFTRIARLRSLFDELRDVFAQFLRELLNQLKLCFGALGRRILGVGRGRGRADARRDVERRRRAMGGDGGGWFARCARGALARRHRASRSAGGARGECWFDRDWSIRNDNDTRLRRMQLVLIFVVVIIVAVVVVERARA